MKAQRHKGAAAQYRMEGAAEQRQEQGDSGGPNATEHSRNGVILDDVEGLDVTGDLDAAQRRGGTRAPWEEGMAAATTSRRTAGV